MSLWQEGDPLTVTNLNTKGSASTAAPTQLALMNQALVSNLTHLSVTVPGSTLSVDGSALHVRIRGVTGTSNVTVTLNFGSGTVLNAYAVSSGTNPFMLDAILRRTGASSVVAHATMFTKNSNYDVFTSNITVNLSLNGALTLQSGAIPNFFACDVFDVTVVPSL